MEVWLHTSLASVLHRGEKSASSPDCFISTESLVPSDMALHKMVATRMTRECASQISVNIECCNLKYRPNGAHHETGDMNDEVNKDSLLGINLDINELQKYCNMFVCPHAMQVMSASISKVVHKFATIKCKCREVLIPKPKWCDTGENRRYTRNKIEEL